jgi:hypothetical protein
MFAIAVISFRIPSGTQKEKKARDAKCTPRFFSTFLPAIGSKGISN